MRRLALPCALLLALAGCGGDDDESAQSVTVDSGGTVQIEATEYSFDPDAVVVDGGGQLTIELENTGNLAHNLRVERDGEDVGGTPTFEEGRTETARLRLDRGTYTMICSVGDHAELGMKGRLEVR